MTIERMEHVGIVVDDLEAATAFFVELGLKLQGEGQVEGGCGVSRLALEGSGKPVGFEAPVGEVLLEGG